MGHLAGKHLEEYARTVLALKGHKDDSKLGEALKACEVAFGTVYHAVALDVDGTITEHASLDMPGSLQELLVSLLNGGTFILLITGRGRGSSIPIVSKLLRQDGFSELAMTRLYLVTHHGCRLLGVTKDDDGYTLGFDQVLTERPRFLDEVKNLLIQEQTIGPFVRMTLEPCCLRVVVREEHAGQTERIHEDIESFRKRLPPQWVSALRVLRGRYEDRATFDITPTDKLTALGKLAGEFLGIHTPIVRVGDCGAIGENDYELLDCETAFSVDSMSKHPGTCLPVLDDDLKRLKGWEGTYHLLKTLRICSALSISPTVVHRDRERVTRKLARLSRGAERLTHKSIDIWKEHATAYLESKWPTEIAARQFADVFDHKSGAVAFRAHDWEEVKGSQLAALFDEQDYVFGEPGYKGPRRVRSMFSDTKLLLRGPRYYAPLIYPITDDLFRDLLVELNEKLLPEILAIELDKDIQLAGWKLGLAVLDNIRNICLNVLSSLFQAMRIYELREGDVPPNDQNPWRGLFVDCERFAFLCVRALYAYLMVDADEFYAVRDLIWERREVLGPLTDRRVELFGYFDRYRVKPGRRLRKWREADHPGQNLAAMMAVAERLPDLDVPQGKEIRAIGISYGGTELPCILHYIAEKQKLPAVKLPPVTPLVIHMPGYGEEREPLRGPLSRTFLDKVVPYVRYLDDLIAEGDVAVLLDDNTTTGRTLELARDCIVAYGADVPLLAVVRHPGENRIPHMLMSRHGCLEPALLGETVVGLIAPSPYSRLFNGHPSGNYLDSTGVFDMARMRILRYLRKNGLFDAQRMAEEEQQPIPEDVQEARDIRMQERREEETWGQ